MIAPPIYNAVRPKAEIEDVREIEPRLRDSGYSLLLPRISALLIFPSGKSLHSADIARLSLSSHRVPRDAPHADSVLSNGLLSEWHVARPGRWSAIYRSQNDTRPVVMASTMNFRV